MEFQLPPIAPYPDVRWKTHLSPKEWEVCLDSWITLGRAHLALSSSDFLRISLKDGSLTTFIISFVSKMSISEELLSIQDSPKLKIVRKLCFLLCYRALESKYSPELLLSLEFLTNANKTFGRINAGKLYSLVKRNYSSVLESSLMSLKASLTRSLDGSMNINFKDAELQLKKLNFIVNAYSEVAHFLMAGSDFLEALINGFKVMNLPLRKVIISNIYLCLMGLTKGENTNISLLVDQLYSLKAAAESRQEGLTHSSESLISELLTRTPILEKLQQHIRMDDKRFGRAKVILSSLENLRKSRQSGRWRRAVKRREEKGKSKEFDVENHEHQIDEQFQTHRVSLISQVQELLPDLGSRFITRVLKEYDDDVESAISHILEGTLPRHLQNLDRTEPFEDIPRMNSSHELATEKLPPASPTRRNIFDNDEFDRLVVDTSRLYFGRRNPSHTAETLLNDRSLAPTKAAILSALASFDPDDDERDDTYDFTDVGGTVDAANREDDLEAHAINKFQIIQNETLFRTYKANPEIFKRDGVTRRGKGRERLKEEVGLTDEVIEGWALMLSRDPKLQQKLESKYDSPDNTHRNIVGSSWKSRELEKMENDNLTSLIETKNQTTRETGATKQQSTEKNIAKDSKAIKRTKETNKSSRANHNRKYQRAKKVARGGLSEQF